MNTDHRPLTRLLFRIAAVALVASSALAEDTRLQRAHDEYAIGHYGSAFALFSSLAGEGHCEAARIALLMQRFGPPLYATDFQVPRQRIEAWQRAPGCSVAPVAR